MNKPNGSTTIQHTSARRAQYLLSGGVEDWRERAVCPTTDKDIWFPDDDGHYYNERGAKAICATCPVKSECLDFAMVNEIEFGIFGGMDEKDREEYREAWLDMVGEAQMSHLRESFGIPDAMYATRSVEAKYTRREYRARDAYEKLLNLDLRKKPERYEYYVECVEAVLRNPTATGEELGKSLGIATPTFNQRLRECFKFLGMDLSVL